MEKKHPAKMELRLPVAPVHRRVGNNRNLSKSILYGLTTLLLLLISAAVVHSEEIPWTGKIFLHVSEDQPVDSLLKDIFMSEGILVNISASVVNTPVSGKFDKPAAQVFDQIATTFNLIWYYDGQVVYIYPTNEIQSKTMPVRHVSIAKIKKSLNEMGIIDRKYLLRYYPKERLVMVQGPQIYVERITGAVKTIDVVQNWRKKKAPELQNVRIFKLKHAWAADRQLQIRDQTVKIQGVATILKGLTHRRDNQWFSSGSMSPDDHVGPRVTKVNQAAAIGAKSEEKQNKQPLADVDYQPESKHTIQCAERLNAVIINASPANMAYYEKMIAELDVPLQLIEIKASIIDVDSEALSSIGLDMEGSHRLGDGSNTYNSNLIPTDNPLTQLTKIGAGSFGGLNFSAILGDLADDFFTLRLKALESKGKARIVSKPSIITFDNIEARFTNTETFYVRVAAQDDASLYQVSAGIILKVTPHLIFDDHPPQIQLLISIEDGKIKGGEVDEIPVVENSTINTQAVVSGDESLLIGGLIFDSHKEIDRKVPVLGDIPLLGMLFRSKDKIKSKTERLFLISPRILGADGLADISVQDGNSYEPQTSYRNWPPIKLFETTF